MRASRGRTGHRLPAGKPNADIQRLGQNAGEVDMDGLTLCRARAGEAPWLTGGTA